MLEIERRWLVAKLPDRLPDGERIEQGYLMTAPAAVRVRRRGDAHTLTIKTAITTTSTNASDTMDAHRGLARTEIERDLSPEEFAALWEVATELRIDKHRYLIAVGGGVAELDLFHGALDRRRLVEVEFASVPDADAFVAPDWFGQEVTDNPDYTNASLARNGWPTD